MRARHTRRRLLTGAPIVLFWAVMVGLLLHRQMGSRHAPAPPWEVEATTGSSESWLGVFLPSGQRAGLVHTTTTPELRDGQPGVAWRVTARLRLAYAGETSDVALSGALWRAVHENRGEIEALLRSASHTFDIQGTIEGAELRATVHTAGESFPIQAPVDEGFINAVTAGLRFPVGELAPGQEMEISTFDPLSLRPAPATVRLLGVEPLEVRGEMISTRVVEVRTGGTRLRAWIADDQEVVKAELPFGLVLRTLSRAEALAGTAAGGGADLVAQTIVRPSGQRPFRGARRMVVRIGGLADGTAPPFDDMQAPGDEPGVLVIPPPPDSNRPSGPASPEELAAALRCDALVQCSHPRIIAQAQFIVGSEDAPWRQALLINRWVHENLAKRSVLSVPSALDVLATREGDCNEHTVLFAALARATGLPTRTVIGLVWSEDLEGFGYHAWPEVYTGRWLAMDPTLGQETADATHIKLVSGDLESWVEILSFLGELELEVLEVS